MKQRLLIVGAGGLAGEVKEMADLLGYDVVGFLDDAPDKARCRPVIGSMRPPEAYRDKADAVAVAIGNNKGRMSLCEAFQQAGFALPVLIHPAATVSKRAVLEDGCLVRAGAVVSGGAVLKRACLVNVGALIDHDCVLMEGVHAAMGSVIRGDVTVEALTHVLPGQIVQPE